MTGKRLLNGSGDKHLIIDDRKKLSDNLDAPVGYSPEIEGGKLELDGNGREGSGMLSRPLMVSL